MSIAPQTDEPCPEFMRFEAVIHAMNFSDRRWILKAMQTFGIAMEETRLARRAHDKRIAKIFESGTVAEQADILAKASALQAREALLAEFAWRHLEILREFQRFGPAGKIPRLGISPRFAKGRKKRKRL